MIPVNNRQRSDAGSMSVHRLRRWPNIDPASGLPIAYQEQTFPANTRHSLKVCPMLDQRRRRWANIGQTLGECLVVTDVVHEYL